MICYAIQMQELVGSMEAVRVRVRDLLGLLWGEQPCQEQGRRLCARRPGTPTHPCSRVPKED